MYSIIEDGFPFRISRKRSYFLVKEMDGMNANKSAASVAPATGTVPLAFDLAVVAEPQEGDHELISTPTGSGYPPEDDA